MVTLTLEQYACIGYITMFFVNLGVGFVIIAGAIELADKWSKRNQ